MPVTSPAAPPPVEPPALRVGSHGLRVRPNTSLNVFPPAANSGQFVLPRITAPASRSRRTTNAILGRYVVPVERGAIGRAEPRDGRDVLDADRQAREQTHLFAGTSRSSSSPASSSGRGLRVTTALTAGL